MPVPAVTTTAVGSLALLEDDDPEIKVYALKHLLKIVPMFWHEIADRMVDIEVLADSNAGDLPDDALPLASLLVSKVYYYMGEHEEAVDFALECVFDFSNEEEGEYKQTIIAACVDRALKLTYEMNEKNISEELWIIVEKMIKSSTGENAKLAMGLALSLRRLDLLEMLYVSSRSPTSSPSSSSKPSHDEGLLRYVMNEYISGPTGNDPQPPSWRLELLRKLLALFDRSATPDWTSITTLWIQIGDPEPCSDALVDLLETQQEPEAYQIGFDLAEMADQSFIEAVLKKLAERGYGLENSPEGDRFRSTNDSDFRPPFVILNEILNGTKSAEIFLNFLQRNNKTDMAMLKATRTSLEDRYSIYHSAITFTNAFANCGTTSDKFLRENLDWLGRASNWAKFSTTAALGLIHRGSWINGMKVVKPYLPGGSAPSKFSEGGALFALGLIYAGKKEGPEAALKNGLKEENDPIVQHGAALGLGMSCLATHDDYVYEEVKNALFQDQATTGEAAGYAMGLIMLGSESERAIEEMLSYARETQHEKIIRSLSIGLAFIMYGKKERADEMIKTLTEEKDAIMRYGGMFTIALAYAGTGNNKAIRKLLHVAVSDVNDDVRRAAVTALGFVLFRNHTQVPRVVQLLAESYNPHVRHGATLALGISCAGTGLESAIELLEPMTKDPVDFVRQGAYISLAMILIQQSEAQQPKVASIRELFAKVVADKHEDPIARFGASLAQGIIDAGGRNMTLSLSTRAGTLDMKAIVGMTLFVQFWYWYPLAHGLGLAFHPTVVAGVDPRMRVPAIDFTCQAKPSTFAYPAGAKKEVEKKEVKAKTAVLSTTAKSKAREKTKKEEKGESMDMDEKEEEAEGSSPAPQTSATKRKAEPSSFTLPNFTRVTAQQSSLIALKNKTYEPVRPINPHLASSSKADADRPRGPNAMFGGQSREIRATGSIVVLKDLRPKGERPEEDQETEGDFIHLDPLLWPTHPSPSPTEVEAEGNAPAAEAEGGAGAGGNSASGRGFASVTREEAPPPAPFEYPFEDDE